jgi:S1-C subfamily serine protease
VGAGLWARGPLVHTFRVNVFDLVVIALVVIATLFGFRSGAVPQVAGLIGAVAGGALAILALPHLETPLEAIEPSLRAFVVLAGILFSVGLGEAIGSAIGRSAAALLGQGVFGAIDRLLGACVGAAQALLVVWLTGGLLAAGPSASLASQAQTSVVVRGLSQVLPAPTELAGELAGLLNNSGLPNLFVGLEPLPAPPVELPHDPFVRALAAGAQPSTVKVTAATCLSLSSGTGFVVDRGYVVTNAHVIAGASLIRVTLGTTALDATAVLLDPQLDIALLYTPGLSAPALRFAANDPVRGADGATLGFPGGGRLSVEPAAVAGSYAAQGRDIYGEARVTRRILELRAKVDRGDSGGPLILADGTVGGVVFAEARTDEDVGYALTPTSVRVAIAPAVGRTGAVSTGVCIH